MNPDQIAAIAKQYEDRFGNLDEIVHLEIMYKPEFGDLLQSALHANVALTQTDVDRQFPNLSWEW